MDSFSQIDPSIADFLTRFFEVSDISPTFPPTSGSDAGAAADAAGAEIHEKWASFFRGDATLVMGSEKGCGLGGMFFPPSFPNLFFFGARFPSLYQADGHLFLSVFYLLQGLGQIIFFLYFLNRGLFGFGLSFYLFAPSLCISSLPAITHILDMLPLCCVPLCDILLAPLCLSLSSPALTLSSTSLFQYLPSQVSN